MGLLLTVIYLHLRNCYITMHDTHYVRVSKFTLSISNKKPRQRENRKRGAKVDSFQRKARFVMGEWKCTNFKLTFSVLSAGVKFDKCLSIVQ